MTVDLAKQIERLEIVIRPIAELVPYAKNSRTHSPSQIDKLAKLIQEFGFTNPVLLDGESGILAGHGRIIAAKRLGMKKVPTLDLSHLTVEQRQAYVIADNKIALDAGWDAEILAMELGELAEVGYDLALTAWTQKELEELLGESLPPSNDGDGTEEPERAPDMVVPLMIEMPRGLFNRWKKYRNGRTDLEAFEAAITSLEVG
jgi:ParB-like chromosome segregation protein Spo0J